MWSKLYLHSSFSDAIMGYIVFDLCGMFQNAGVNSTAWPSPREMVDTYKKRVSAIHGYVRCSSRKHCYFASGFDLT